MDINKLLKNFKNFSIGPIVSALLSLIATPIFTYFLSPDEYGKASMFTVAISIIQLVVFLGMDQAYSKRYYESEHKNKLMTNAIFPSFVFCAIIGLVLFCFSENVSYVLFGTYSEIICVYALIIMLPALAIERFGQLSIRMEQRSALYSSLMILLKVIVIVSTMTFILLYQKSFRAIVFGQVVAELIYSAILMVIQKNILIIHFSWIDWVEMKRLLRFGLPLVPTTIIGWALNGTDKVMLRFFSDYSEIGLYAIAMKMVAVLTIVQSSFTTFWVPIAHQWNNEKVDKAFFSKAGTIMSLVMSGIFLLTILGREVVLLLFKPEYGGASSIVPFLLFIPIMYTISEVTVMGIYFKEKTSWTIIVSFVSALVNVILNIILIPVMGAIGASIATGISYICFFWVRTIISRRLWFSFPLNDYLFTTIVLLVSATISTFVHGWMPYLINTALLFVVILYYKTTISRLFKSIKMI